MTTIIGFFKTAFPYLLGGIGGAFLTILYNRWSNRIQKINCYYVDDDTITKIPVISETGEQHKNIYTKEFKLKNTTNKDIPSIRIIFEFDATAKIIKHDTFCKTGKNDIKPKKKKPNECSFVIKNFNRNDEVRFFFDIANIAKDIYNITEAECIGFKIVTKDKRKPSIKNKSQIVTKDQIT